MAALLFCVFEDDICRKVGLIPKIERAIPRKKDIN